MSTAQVMRAAPSMMPNGRLVALDRVVPSLTNPRKSTDKAALQELAASIREHGVLQPIVVREWPSSRKAPKDVEAPLEIVFGEQRWLAAKELGLEEVPVLVREVSDDQVLQEQLVENLQRRDLHALEEAAGFRELMAKGHDVARVAAQTGRSVKYVYDRVKLLSLTAAAQKAFLAGRFTAGHAILLARLSTADQKRAMEEHNALFTDEHPLFGPEDSSTEPLKPRSVRELDDVAITLKPLGVNVAKILEAAAPLEARCGKCGCTEAKACAGGCAWVKKPDPKTGLGLCSACVPARKSSPKKGR